MSPTSGGRHARIAEVACCVGQAAPAHVRVHLARGLDFSHLQFTIEACGSDPVVSERIATPASGAAPERGASLGRRGGGEGTRGGTPEGGAAAPGAAGRVARAARV